ncbi:hypothetical protein AB0K52_14735 [Glycomyces sp. NPDC049804]|uniref:hypothetical protein n=1 Tax=Glycomyces sp. NPDC049804 TaxID=3154363 RepID=UPI00343E1640
MARRVGLRRRQRLPRERRLGLGEGHRALDLPGGLEVRGPGLEGAAQVGGLLVVAAGLAHAVGPGGAGLDDAVVALPVGAAAGAREAGVVEVVGVGAVGEGVLGFAHAAASGALGLADVGQEHGLGLHAGRAEVGREVGVLVRSGQGGEGVGFGAHVLAAVALHDEGDAGVVDFDAVDLHGGQGEVGCGVDPEAEEVVEAGVLGVLVGDGVDGEALEFDAEAGDAFEGRLDLVCGGHVVGEDGFGGGAVDRFGGLGAGGQEGGREQGRDGERGPAPGAVRHWTRRCSSLSRSRSARTCRRRCGSSGG